jgi:hypothetical protein
MRLLSIELPLAHERNDYRNVTDDEIETGLAPAGVHDPSITLAPHGVVFAVRGE